MANYMDLKGTTHSSFTIGRRGPTLTPTSTGNVSLDIEAVSTTTASGRVSVNGANGFAGTNNAGGFSRLQAGDGDGTGNGGTVSLVAGAAPSTGIGGNATIAAGSSSGGPAGQVIIAGGAGTTNGGLTDIRGGNATTSGSPGDVIIRPGAGGDNDAEFQIRISNGLIQTTSNIGALAPVTTLHADGGAAGSTHELRFDERQDNGDNYVGFKAPNAIAADVMWTLPDADGGDGDRLTTDGAGVLSWASPSVYEVYDTTAQTLTTTPVVIGFNTERFANADFTLGGTGAVVVNRTGLYKLTYAMTSDSTNATRDVTMAEIYINGVAHPASETFAYHRNTGNGEGTASKSVLAQLVATDSVEMRGEIFSGNGCVTRANQSNLIFERVGA